MLNKYLKQIKKQRSLLTCAPIAELPFNISTMYAINLENTNIGFCIRATRVVDPDPVFSRGPYTDSRAII